MKIVHRISKVVDAKKRDQLRALGIEVGIGLSTFEIDESHPSWEEIGRLSGEWESVDIVTTIFSKMELSDAPYVEIGPSWHHGYPQPEDDFEYLIETYDLSAYCRSCGMGARQVAPFRMKGEPRWGTKHLLQLNWVYDEFFVLPEIWREVFRPIGIACSPVVKHSTGKILETVVQLDVQGAAPSDLCMGGHPFETCAECGRKKYLPFVRGFFPPFESGAALALCRTKESFGSGASAWNAIIASNEVYRAIRDHKLKGVTFAAMGKLESNH